ncbi:hypothetical protein DPMN_194122 [Dreissena polymorpha]|uniref:Uncharacterized protein n=1 Tax=Dreissena polymorpha TaxID=45954 RepID=A0A9D3Y4P5_DREPO|nr:hypothetical protein DPMN_194122 [Dreissena polymorpha]
MSCHQHKGPHWIQEEAVVDITTRTREWFRPRGSSGRYYNSDSAMVPGPEEAVVRASPYFRRCDFFHVTIHIIESLLDRCKPQPPHCAADLLRGRMGTNLSGMHSTYQTYMRPERELNPVHLSAKRVYQPPR